MICVKSINKNTKITMATIQIGGFIFQIVSDDLENKNEDLIHFKNCEEETYDNMVYFRDSMYYISSSDSFMYKTILDWYFYIRDYGLNQNYQDIVIFLDLNEFYMNELKKEIQKVREITITTDPDEFKTIDNIFTDMNSTLDYMKGQDKLLFDIGEMMRLIHEFVGEYFNPY